MNATLRGMTAASGTKKILTAPVLLVLCLGYGSVCLYLANSGFSNFDDHYYLQAADGWLRNVPFVGTTHWHLRHPLVLSITASFRILGRSELAMIVPSVICYFGILILTFRLVEEASDVSTAVIATVLVASTPLLAIYGKIPYPDEMELFLTILSLWFFLTGTKHDRSLDLLASGFVLGLAWSLRETSFHLVVFYGILFLVGYRIPRRRYFLIAAGFIPILMMEWSFYWIMVGNPFYRFAVDTNSLRLPTADAIGKVLPRGASPPFSLAIMRAWAPTGPVHLHWLIDPYIDFVLDANYGFICATGVVSTVLLLRSRITLATRSFAILICAWSAVAIFVVLYVLNLGTLSRYFAPVAWSMAVMTGLWIRNIVMVRSPAAACGILLVLALFDIALINLRPDPVHLTRELVVFEEYRNQPVSVDSSIDLADFILQDAGVSGITRTSSPAQLSHGALLFTTSVRARDLEANGWTEVWRDQPKFAALARPLEPFQHWLPAKINFALTRGYPELLVLRAP